MDEGSACGSKPMSNTLFGGTNSHQQKDFDVKNGQNYFTSSNPHCDIILS